MVYFIRISENPNSVTNSGPRVVSMSEVQHSIVFLHSLTPPLLHEMQLLADTLVTMCQRVRHSEWNAIFYS